jgi:hypothetical protein
LTNRKQQIIINDTKSTQSTVLSSVPQGTILAPLLFTLLLNDIDSGTDPHTKVLSFADDTKISRKVKERNDAVILQDDASKIYQWAETNNMQFNPEKFQLLRYGKIKIPMQYVGPDNQEIVESETVCDLGVHMSKDAKFEVHNDTAVNKAKRAAGYILRTFKSRSKEIMLPLLKTLVLPKLEYCSILTAPYKKEDINKMEQVQGSFTAKIEGIQHLNYWDRLKELDLYSLERRRERYAIIYVWKILEHLVKNPDTYPIQLQTNVSNRKGRMCRIPRLVAHQGTPLTLKENSFPIRGPRLFNALPKEIRNLNGISLNSFKSRLDKWLRTIPDEPGVSGYTGMKKDASNSLLELANQKEGATTGLYLGIP